MYSNCIMDTDFGFSVVENMDITRQGFTLGVRWSLADLGRSAGYSGQVHANFAKVNPGEGE